LMFCLSKGLSAPVGSLVVGDHDFIGRARKCRMMLGGGMRQAGIIAAAGIIAIEKMVDRLKDDHANAKMLASGLAKLGVPVDPATVQTNILIYDVSGLGVNADTWVSSLSEYGIKFGAVDAKRVRMVTHRGVEKDDIEYTLNVAAKVVDQLKGKS
jgi:threonine aldolase